MKVLSSNELKGIAGGMSVWAGIAIAAAVVFTNVFFILFISFFFSVYTVVSSGWMPVALRRSFIASLLL